MITLYHSPRTRSVRVLWLLEELGVPYELQVVQFTAEALRSAQHLQVHPLGKVPAIRDGDLTMFESGAILEFILERYAGGRLAPPPESPLRGPYLQWFHYGEATMLPPLGDLAQNLFIRPEAERIPAVVPDARARAARALGVVERALDGKSYLLGSTFSAADIMTGYGVLLGKWFGLLGEFPNVTAYVARLEDRPALQKALAA
jgi:glutathione S-transferase